ncbi:neprosin family prolyl endopeptidase [Methylobacter luteus]|jgi:hypothetical protein|uniref:neprosin family prolyl endopeptidase n=1 Tax=Methylobacter luteus TaxID=415 RepID=UPI00041F77B6|nr:neprosin family prolyl endopeptidase [Methylobacter luteus]
MTNQNPIPAFHDFVQSLYSARYDEFRAREQAKVESPEAFEEMRQHLLNLYEGVEAPHTFLESEGQIVDCIPAEQQPSLKNSGHKLLAPPSEPPPVPVETYSKPKGPTSQYRKVPPPQLHPDYFDCLGNQMWCPEGTIPIIRTTLEQLSCFSNLHQFLRSGGNSGVKCWAQAAEHINNLGGSSYVNVWKPQVFGVQNSASQQWYQSPQAPFVTYQSVECGWRVGTPSPPFDNNPRLFVYFTANNHACYNLLCPGSFEQHPDSHVLLGGALKVSQPGGDQYSYLMGFFLTGNAWWFNYEGKWVGYYRTSLFQGGPLASNAGSIGFGGETSGIGAFPPMGSGKFPSAGEGNAAYQRNVTVTPVGGAARPANLTPGQQFPSCYNIDVKNNSSTAWGTYIYFGGPGGINCRP